MLILITALCLSLLITFLTSKLLHMLPISWFSKKWFAIILSIFWFFINAVLTFFATLFLFVALEQFTPITYTDQAIMAITRNALLASFVASFCFYRFIYKKPVNIEQKPPTQSTVQ